MKVFISTTTFAKFDEKPLKILRDKGFQPELNPHGRAISREELLDVATDVEGLIAGTELLDADLLSRLKSLKVISRCGAGLDSVDMDKARELGIQVFNTPDVVTLPVAELVVGLMISLMRHVCISDRQMREGVWTKRTGTLVHGKKIGIIGLGRIGKAVANLLKPFGVELYYSDAQKQKDTGDIQYLELDELLKTVDIVTIHVPLLDETRDLIDKAKLGLMKKGSFLINCSRGGIVNEEDLHKMLENGHLGGAAIDVYSNEPYDGILKQLDNVILTPHIGSYAREARIQMEIESVENLLQGFKA